MPSDRSRRKDRFFVIRYCLQRAVSGGPRGTTTSYFMADENYPRIQLMLVPDRTDCTIPIVCRSQVTRNRTSLRDFDPFVLPDIAQYRRNAGAALGAVQHLNGKQLRQYSQ